MTTTARGDRVVVHVAGAVAHPGVVKVPSGSRGLGVSGDRRGRDADLDRLNLAAKLSDGERVLVQRVGDPAAPAEVRGTRTNVGTGLGTGTDGGTGLVNLNSATQAQLEALPGIGPSLASAILSERQRRGSFRSVNELRNGPGIGEKRFTDLRSRMTL